MTARIIQVCTYFCAVPNAVPQITTKAPVPTGPVSRACDQQHCARVIYVTGKGAAASAHALPMRTKARKRDLVLGSKVKSIDDLFSETLEVDGGHSIQIAA